MLASTFGFAVVIAFPAAAVAMVIGVIPSSILGFVTGLSIGWLLKQMESRPSPSWAFVAGLAISVAVTLLIHLVLRFGIDENIKQFFLFRLFGYTTLLGIPSLIYMAATAWWSWKLAGGKNR